MDKNTREVLWEAICENVEDVGARKLIQWVFDCELQYGWDENNTKNAWIASNWGWNDNTVRTTIWLAKKSGFISTTGKGRKRTFEANQTFARGKMGEIVAKKIQKPPKENILSGIVPDNIPDKKTDIVPDNIPDKKTDIVREDTYYKEKRDKENKREENTSEPSSQDDSILLKKLNLEIQEIIKLFEPIDPRNKRFYGNKTQRKACKDLIEQYGFEEVSKVIPLLEKTNKKLYYPQITTPFELWNKYQKLKSALYQQKEKSKQIKRSEPNFIL